MHHHGGDIYSHRQAADFSANINYKGMPDSVKEAARAGVEACIHYPDTACRKLREAIACREQVDVEQVICGNGAADLIFSLVLAKKPKQALLCAPTFYEYEQALRTVDCRIRRYYLRESHGFLLQQDFLQAVTEDIDLIFLCNPNNPTGVTVNPKLLLQVLKRCREKGTLLVVDECFLDFLEDGERISMKPYLEKRGGLFIVKAFTKMYAMAGLRLGYGLCGEEKLLEKMYRVRQPWSVSIPAQMAGIAAAGDLEFARESRLAIRKEREFLKEKLKGLGYQSVTGEANYIFFRGPKGLYDTCLEQGILIRDCSNYEGLSEGWYRIAVRGRKENLRLLRILGLREGE